MSRDTEHTWHMTVGGWVVVLRLNWRRWVDVRTAALTVSWARRHVEAE